MQRIEARERVAYGIICDCCEELIPVRSAVSRPPGYYIKAIRVTDNNVMRTSDGELYFHTKECMIEALSWKFSHLVTERIFDDEHPRPRSYGG